MLKPEIGLVIFDCDGVLIDSEIISGRILISLLGEIGVDVDFGYVQRHFLGRSFTKVAAEIRGSFGKNLAPDFEDRYRRKLAAAFAADLRPMAGVEEVLGQIGTMYCMATSSSPARARISLELSGLARYFGERVYTASQVSLGKPAPDLFLHAAAAMGVPPNQCLVIEDSKPGVEAALAAGMKVLRFVGGSHMKSLGESIAAEIPDVLSLHSWEEFFEIVPELRQRRFAGGKRNVGQD